jgi:hypothetical protein
MLELCTREHPLQEAVLLRQPNECYKLYPETLAIWPVELRDQLVMWLIYGKLGVLDAKLVVGG